jgi:hypothetical protein
MDMKKRAWNKLWYKKANVKACDVPDQTVGACRRSRGRAVFILNVGTWWRWVTNFTPWPFYPWERTPVPMKPERWVGSRAGLCVSKMREVSLSAGIPIPDRPARKLVSTLDYFISTAVQEGKGENQIQEFCLASYYSALCFVRISRTFWLSSQNEIQFLWVCWTLCYANEAVQDLNLSNSICARNFQQGVGVNPRNLKTFYKMRLPFAV